MWKEHRKRKKAKLAKAEAVARRALALSLQYEQQVITRTDLGVNPDAKPNLVVSLTSFDKRINDVYLTIESLFNQSHQANRIVLWLSEQDFTADTLPATLKRQQQRGLEVRFCAEDLGPYTKFFYALEAFPDSLLLTVDDDILYPLDMIDQLMRAHRAQPDMIHCQRGHMMRLGSDGRALPYREWHFSSNSSAASPNMFPTGVGGVLYFPGCFAPEVTDKETFQRLCPHSDDVWLKAMSLKQGTLCRRIEDHRDWSARAVQIAGSQQFSLKRKNKQSDTGNDPKIRAVFEHYDLWQHLRPEPQDT